VESFPQVFDAAHAPLNVIALMDSVVPALLTGDDSVHTALREQFSVARVGEVELSGAGFFVTFVFDEPVHPVVPASISSGHARIVLEGHEIPAGCVLFVRNGQLSMFEVYTYDGPWTFATRVAQVDTVIPVQVTVTAGGGSA